MKLKVGNERLKHFSKPVIKAERTGSWLWWLTGGVCVGTILWLWYKIVELYAIHLWLENV